MRHKCTWQRSGRPRCSTGEIWVHIARVGDTDLAHRTKSDLQEDIYPVLDNAYICVRQHADNNDRPLALLFRQWTFRT
jgi:hypothetical protein